MNEEGRGKLLRRGEKIWILNKHWLNSEQQRTPKVSRFHHKSAAWQEALQQKGSKLLTDKVDVEGDVAGVHLCDADHLLLARGDTVRVVRPPLPLPSSRAQPGGVHCNLVFFLLDVDMLCLVIFICYIIRWFRLPHSLNKNNPASNEKLCTNNENLQTISKKSPVTSVQGPQFAQLGADSSVLSSPHTNW